MSLKAKPLSILLVVVLYSSVTAANIIGRWDSELKPQDANDNDRYFATRPAPTNINDSNTFGDIDRLFNIPTTILAKAFNLPAEINSTAFTIKEIQAIYVDQDIDIGSSSVRLFVALYNGLSYETTEPIFLPLTAVDMLISHRALLPEQVEFMETYAIVLDLRAAAVSSSNNRGQSEEREIKGKTTFQELLNWGLPQEIIEQIIGEPILSSYQIVKDYCTEKGLDFEEIKLALMIGEHHPFRIRRPGRLITEAGPHRRDSFRFFIAVGRTNNKLVFAGFIRKVGYPFSIRAP